MLYIMRHGKTDWNEIRKLQGRTDIPLNEKGRAMAEEVRGECEKIGFDVCYCSPLKRASETAEIALKGLDVPIIFDDRLMEMSFGIYEGVENASSQPELYINVFFENPKEYKGAEGGETMEELFARTGEFLKEVVEPELAKGKNILIVGHGAMNCSLICHLKNLPVENFWDIGISNCKLIKINTTKMFVYNYRDFDEKQYFDNYADDLGIDIVSVPFSPTLENADLVKGCQCVNIITTPITAEMIEKYHQLGIKYIVTRTVGYDHIDIEAAKNTGIIIANTPYGPEAVAEYALMLTLMCLRKADLIQQRFAIQDYTLKNLIGRQLSGMTVGIIGAGSIGMYFAKLLSGFGCKILICTPHHNKELPEFAEYADLEKLVSESDVISLHAPLNNETYYMIGKEQFSKMKDGVIIVNTARGALIDTEALIDALDSGKIGAAGLDVIENESELVYYDRRGDVINRKDLYLLKSYPNVIVTHHMAFYTEQTIETMVRDSLRGAECHFTGKENPWRVF